MTMTLCTPSVPGLISQSINQSINNQSTINQPIDQSITPPPSRAYMNVFLGACIHTGTCTCTYLY